MSKQRDTDTKANNRTNFEQRGNASQVSQANVQNRDMLNETDAAKTTSNPVSSDMAKSRGEAIKANSRK